MLKQIIIKIRSLILISDQVSNNCLDIIQRTMKKVVRQHHEYYVGTKPAPNKSSPSPINNSNSQVRPICDNHNDKHATHRFFSEESEQFLFYCQKCSIMLASQGFNVQRLSGRQRSGSLKANVKSQIAESPKRIRLNQIQDFLQGLENYLQILSVKYTEVEDNLVKSQQQYNYLMQSITSYYDAVQQILELQKYLSYNALLTRRSSQEGQLRILRDNVKDSIIEIQDMMNDVSSNLDAVQGVQEEIYYSIMQGYNQKLSAVPQLINFECKMPEQYSIMLPQIPDILNTLSDRFMLYAKGKTPNQPSKFVKHQFQPFSRSKQRQIKQFYSHYQSPNVHLGSKNSDKEEGLKKSQSQCLKQRVALGQISQSKNSQQRNQQQFYQKQIDVHQYSGKNKLILSKKEVIENMRFSFEGKDNNLIQRMSQSKSGLIPKKNSLIGAINIGAFGQQISDAFCYSQNEQSDSLLISSNL